MPVLQNPTYAFRGAGIVPDGCPFDPSTGGCGPNGDQDCSLIRECDPATGSTHYQYFLPDGSASQNANIFTLNADGEDGAIFLGSDGVQVIKPPTGYTAPEYVAGFGWRPAIGSAPYAQVVSVNGNAIAPAFSPGGAYGFGGALTPDTGIDVRSLDSDLRSVGGAVIGGQAVIPAASINSGDLENWLKALTGRTEGSSDEFCVRYQQLTGVPCSGVDVWGGLRSMRADVFLNGLIAAQRNAATGASGTLPLVTNGGIDQAVFGPNGSDPSISNMRGDAKGTDSAGNAIGPGLMGHTNCPSCKKAASNPIYMFAIFGFLAWLVAD